MYNTYAQNVIKIGCKILEEVHEYNYCDEYLKLYKVH